MQTRPPGGRSGAGSFGTLMTAGDVAFYGTLDRWFKAVDARSGALLWQFHAGSGFVGQPVTYKGADGAQYVAILSGAGGRPAAVAAAKIDPSVRNAALGFVGATQDLPAYTMMSSRRALSAWSRLRTPMAMSNWKRRGPKSSVSAIGATVSGTGEVSAA